MHKGKVQRVAYKKATHCEMCLFGRKTISVVCSEKKNREEYKAEYHSSANNYCVSGDFSKNLEKQSDYTITCL